MRGGQQQQLNIPAFTPWVKRLLIANGVIWVLGVLILQGMILDEPLLFHWFGVVPDKMIKSFWIWQPFTYMFLHSPGVFHILFNMLMLWWLGSDLEARWGGRFFLLYYVVCAMGAAFIYAFGVELYAYFSGDVIPVFVPMVGASGAVFGLLLAYGLLFGDRVFYFMMIIPMKARYMVMILAGIEMANLLSSGPGNRVANLAHLGGLVSGLIFLLWYGNYKTRSTRKRTRKHGRKLHLVVDNESDQGKGGKPPRYWH